MSRLKIDDLLRLDEQTEIPSASAAASQVTVDSLLELEGPAPSPKPSASVTVEDVTGGLRAGVERVAEATGIAPALRAFSSIADLPRGTTPAPRALEPSVPSQAEMRQLPPGAVGPEITGQPRLSGVRPGAEALPGLPPLPQPQTAEEIAARMLGTQATMREPTISAAPPASGGLVEALRRRISGTAQEQAPAAVAEVAAGERGERLAEFHETTLGRQRPLERAAKGLERGAVRTAAGMAAAAPWIDSLVGVKTAAGVLGKEAAEALNTYAQRLEPSDPGFLDQLAEGFGSTAVFWVPGMGTAAAVRAVGRVAPRLASWAGAGQAAVMEAATSAGFGYEDLLRQGVSEADAAQRANRVFWQNLVLLAATNKAGIFAEGGSRTTRIAKGAGFEGAQEGTQEVIQARQEPRSVTEPSLYQDPEVLKRVGTSTAVGSIVGGGFGALGAGAGRRARAAEPEPKALTAEQLQDIDELLPEVEAAPRITAPPAAQPSAREVSRTAEQAVADAERSLGETERKALQAFGDTLLEIRRLREALPALEERVAGVGVERERARTVSEGVSPRAPSDAPMADVVRERRPPAAVEAASGLPAIRREVEPSPEFVVRDRRTEAARRVTEPEVFETARTQAEIEAFPAAPERLIRGAAPTIELEQRITPEGVPLPEPEPAGPAVEPGPVPTPARGAAPTAPLRVPGTISLEARFPDSPAEPLAPAPGTRTAFDAERFQGSRSYFEATPAERAEVVGGVIEQSNSQNPSERALATGFLDELNRAREAARTRPARPRVREVPALETGEAFNPRDPAQLSRFVLARGGVAPSPTGDLSGEYAAIPPRYKNRRGLAPATMAEAIAEEIGQPFTDAELLTALRGLSLAREHRQDRVGAEAEAEVRDAERQREALDLAALPEDEKIRRIQAMTGLPEERVRALVGSEARPEFLETPSMTMGVEQRGDVEDLRQALRDFYEVFPDEQPTPALLDRSPDLRARFGGSRTVADRLFGGDVEALRREVERASQPGSPFTVGEQRAPFDPSPGFVSGLRRALETKMPAAATPEHVLGILRSGSVRQDEIRWTGIEDWLAQRSGRIPKADVLAFVDANRVGLREATLGRSSAPLTWDVIGEDALIGVEPVSGQATPYVIEGAVDRGFTLTIGQAPPESFRTFEEAVEAVEAGRRAEGRDVLRPKFTRYQLPGGTNYREMLLTADVPARKSPATGGGPTPEPFRTPHWQQPDVLAHLRFNERSDTENRRVLFLEELQSDIHQRGRREGYADQPAAPAEQTVTPPIARGAVPSAPFAKTWHELVMMRMLRFASEQGFERLAWTTGEQQVARYGLTDAKAEGMRAFYDRILTDFMNRYGKRWGVRVEPVEIRTQGEPAEFRVRRLGREFVLVDAKSDEILETAPSLAHVKARQQVLEAESRLPSRQVWAIAITPEMRRSVMEQGQPLFGERTLGYTLRDDAGADARRLATEALADLQRVAETAGGGDLPGPGVRGRALRGLEAGAGVRTLALGIPRDLADHGRVDLRGQPVHTVVDLAVLAQMYRDPRYETFRVFYVRGDRIVAHEGVTSRLPGSTRAFVEPRDAKAHYEMRRRMERAGADGYWLLHNHPSGSPHASPLDLTTTERLAERVPGFRGHVIIDSGVAEALELHQGEIVGRQIPIPLPEGRDPLLQPALPHDVLRQPMRNAEDMARLAAEFQVARDQVVLVYRDGDGNVRAVQSMPEALFVRPPEAAAFIRGQQRAFGGADVVAWTESERPEVRQAAEVLVASNALLAAHTGRGEPLIGRRQEAVRAIRVEQEPPRFGKPAFTLQARGARRTFAPVEAERFAEELRGRGLEVEVRPSPGNPRLRQVWARTAPEPPIAQRADVSPEPAPTAQRADSPRTEMTPEGEQVLVPGTPRRTVPSTPLRPTRPQEPAEAGPLFRPEAEPEPSLFDEEARLEVEPQPQAESAAQPGYTPPKTPREAALLQDKRRLVRQLEAVTGVPIRVGRLEGPQALRGVFKIKPEVIRIRGASDLLTASHEVGHFLDKHKLLDVTGFEPQVSALAAGIKGDPVREGTAQFVGVYVTEPTRLEREMPDLVLRFEDTLRQRWPEALSGLLNAREQYQRFREAPVSARVAATIDQRPSGRGLHLSLPSFRTWWHRFYAGLFDDLHIVKVIEDAATQRRPIPADKSPYILGRLTRGVGAVADTFLRHGPIDYNTLRVRHDIPPLRDILRPVWRQRTDFESYLVMRRADELLTGGAGSRPVERLVKAGDRLLSMWGVTPAELRAEIGRVETPEFAQAAEDLGRWNDALLDYLAASGRYAPSVIAQIKALHEQYVPLYRVFEELPDQMAGPAASSRRLADVGAPVKRLKGSERRIVSPLESMVRNAYAITSAANRNEVSAQLADLAEGTEGFGSWMEKIPARRHPVTFRLEDIRSALADAGVEVNEVDLDALATVFEPVRGPEPNVVTIYRQGRPESWQVDPALYRALLNLDRMTLPLWTQLLRVPAQVFRAGVVLAPTFQLRNFVRDQFTAGIQGRAVPFVGYVRGLFEALGRGESYQRWRASGGAIFSNLALDRDALEKTLDDVMAGNHVIQALKPRSPLHMGRALLEAIADVTELSEAPTRIGVFERAMQRPRPEDVASARPERARSLRAAFEAREASLDFARRGGGVITAWTQMTAFLNPWLQGLDKTARTIKEHPAKVTAVAATMILAEFLLHEWNKKQEAYQSVPAWQRDLFWVYCLPGRSTCVRVPGPFEWKIIFSAVPRRVFEWMDEHDPEGIRKMWETVSRGLAQNLVPTAFNPILQNWSNYDGFRDRPIVPRRLEDVPPAEQFTDATSEVAKRIGRALDYAPAKIDQLIRGYLGTLGAGAVRSLDDLLRDTPRLESPVPTAVDFPIIRGVVQAFTSRHPSLDADVIDEFYDVMQRAREAELGLSKIRREGRDAEAFALEHAWELGVYRSFERQSRRFSLWRRQMVQIQNDPDLPPEAKRRQLDEIARNMLTIAAERVEGARELRRALQAEAAGRSEPEAEPVGAGR